MVPEILGGFLKDSLLDRIGLICLLHWYLYCAFEIKIVVADSYLV